MSAVEPPPSQASLELLPEDTPPRARPGQSEGDTLPPSTRRRTTSAATEVSSFEEAERMFRRIDRESRTAASNRSTVSSGSQAPSATMPWPAPYNPPASSRDHSRSPRYTPSAFSAWMEWPVDLYWSAIVLDEGSATPEEALQQTLAPHLQVFAMSDAAPRQRDKRTRQSTVQPCKADTYARADAALSYSYTDACFYVCHVPGAVLVAQRNIVEATSLYLWRAKAPKKATLPSSSLLPNIKKSLLRLGLKKEAAC